MPVKRQFRLSLIYLNCQYYVYEYMEPEEKEKYGTMLKEITKAMDEYGAGGYKGISRKSMLLSQNMIVQSDFFIQSMCRIICRREKDEISIAFSGLKGKRELSDIDTVLQKIEKRNQHCSLNEWC